MQFTAACLLAVLALSVSAKDGRTFAVNHFYGTGPLVTARMDPIVNPGTPAGHLHTVQGGNAFAMNLPADDTLMGSTCTSSLIKNDKSAYWVPSLFFQDPNNGSLIPVPLFYMQVYYFFEATDDKITAFPKGLRMVSGSAKARTPPATGGDSFTTIDNGRPAQPIQWTCPRKDYNVPAYPANSNGMSAGIADSQQKDKGVGFPDTLCNGYASPLRADVHFPSCYNPNAGLRAFETNMQFPTASANNKQNCPPNWIHTPHIFFEVYWNTPLFDGLWQPGKGQQPFVLSNGDKTGYSLHGDFVAAWDEPTLQQIIDNCDAGDNGMENCPGLIGGLNDRKSECTIQPAFTEAQAGVLSALPGNNPLTSFGATVVTPPTGQSPPTNPAPAGSSVAPQGPSSSPPTGSDSGYGSAPSPSPTPVVNEGTSSTNSPSQPTEAISNELVNGPSSGNGSSAPALTGALSGWNSHGCYSDILGDRVLSGKKFVSIGHHQVTTTACVDYCDKKGFTMAGTEFGGQCFCGNELKGSHILAESQCNMPCEGNKNEICGGKLALTVMKKGSTRRRRHLAAHAGKHVRPLKV